MRSPQEIAESLSLLADLMELDGENDFKIRAHRVAADICYHFPQGSEQLLAQIASPGISKIGENLAKKISDLASSPETYELTELKKTIPLSVLELRRVPGLGPKKVKALWQELKIKDLDALKAACGQGLLGGLKGFGEKVQAKVLEGLALIEKYKGMLRLSNAQLLFDFESLLIREHFPKAHISASGELRRSCEVLRSVDMLVASVDLNELYKLNLQSGKFASAKLEGDVLELLSIKNEKVIIQLVLQEDFAVSLFKATGPEEFVDWVDQKLVEPLSARIENEQQIFVECALSYIAPERREIENQKQWDKIEEAEANKLIKLQDIRGIIHCHSTYSDGVDSLKAMALAAKERGYSYLGISDHSVSAGYAGGLGIDKIKSQHKEIDSLNKELAPFRILKGIESDILSDGSLDYEDNILDSFDFVVASIHGGFQMCRAEMTARIVRAIKNPFTSILGHATGRLLLEREPYAVDLEEVIKVAAEEGVILEINANPYRLDIDWRWIQFALSCGAKFSIDPDAHRISGFSDLSYGVAVARKGGLMRDDVITTLEPEEFLKALKA